jgi:potassium-transporting ATPase potassium-binding subunit
MMPLGWIQGLIFMGIFIGLTPLLGSYMAKVFSGKATFAGSTLGRLEKICYLIGGADPKEEMTWREYGKALLLFNLLGFASLFILQLLQGYLPLNPQNLSAVPWPLAWNTAISFTTNTNWQAYSGEAALSYLTQMLGLTSQNFLSAATGMGGLLVLIRGIAGKEMKTIGNFWVDLVRMVVYLLLPLSIILALLLVGEGVVQTFSPYQEIATLENGKQIIPLGPVASQIAIKQLGTNGGGFFNANSAHPFENPTSLSNLLEMLAILLIPASILYAYGIMIGSKRHAWMLFFVCLAFWVGGNVLAYISEYIHNASIDLSPILEGMETRFGVANSILWSISTTTTANGSVNAMLSSLSPLAGGMAMFNIMLGELIFGGIGVGMASMIMMVLLTVFLSGLMVGRTPEYLGKKIEKQEMQLVVIAVLSQGALILMGSGISCLLPQALSSLSSKGPHGLSEILYTFTSCAGNNGSAFAGLNANTPYFNLLLGLVMLLGRIAIILPSLAIGGLLAEKRMTPPSIGTFSTSSALFIILLMSVIFIIGALTFFPALSLGPIIEHLLMLKGETF